MWCMFIDRYNKLQSLGQRWRAIWKLLFFWNAGKCLMALLQIYEMKSQMTDYFIFYFHMKIDFKQNPKIKFDTINEGLEYILFLCSYRFKPVCSLKFTIIITGFMAIHFKAKKNKPQPSRFKLYTTLPICTCDLQKPQRSQHVS